MRYVIYREKGKVREYLAEGNKFVRSRPAAKEFDAGFWLEVIKLVIQLVKMFGYKLKIKKV